MGKSMGFGFFVVMVFSSIVVVKIVAGTLVCLLKTLLVLSLLTYAATYFINRTFYKTFKGNEEDVQVDVHQMLLDLPTRTREWYELASTYMLFVQNIATNYFPEYIRVIQRRRSENVPEELYTNLLEEEEEQQEEISLYD
ncbi:uncharacterized protein LOC108743208 isoform X1 [Agrilus planipennis]|uniref:Uncharacterized protein LOC108743208 isoform X1 n=1 Tax=Agrilus planipennis TaxID=224129 RepID=A0A1W4XN29_AGRPL|nr:uncharacterized protein LOC108743208 isoform X1 [Agrilus planipennis]